MVKTNPIQKDQLHPFCGQTKDHHADLSTLWLDTENTDSYNKYLEYYHDPNLPEKYRLDGDWTYEFNTLGYRGENYDPQAKFHIYTCGCSYTYGIGIKQHQTFSHVFKERLATEIKLSLDEVNLLNFSQRGGSNDYIARTIISQSSQSKPDLALVLFTTKERIEHVDGKQIMNIGSWIKSRKNDNYFKIYSEEMGMINLLKNIMLVQQFFLLNNIPNILSVYCHHEFSNPIFKENSVISQLMAQINWNAICPFSIFDFLCDVGRMCHHPGPLSNLCFGRKLFVFYKKLNETPSLKLRK